MLDAELVEDAGDDEVHEVLDSAGPSIESRGGRQDHDAEARQLEEVLEDDRAQGRLAGDEDDGPPFLEGHRGRSGDQVVRDARGDLGQGRAAARHDHEGPEPMRPGGRRRRMVRASVRLATVADLDLLVRHRRSMFESIATFPGRDLDAADTVYRRWARTRLRTRHLAGFIVEVAGVPVASGCAWIMEVQPHPGRPGTDVVYVLSMLTEPGHRGEGHATRIVGAARRWAKVRGISLMVLHASEFGESIYRRLGFERTREMRRSLVPAPRRSPRSSRKTGRRARRS